VEYFLRFAHSAYLYIFIPLFLLIGWYRACHYKGIVYRYPLTGYINKNHGSSAHPHKKILFLIRFIVLAILLFLIAKPQLVDPESHITVEGIDIMLVLDVSGSMSLAHHTNDERSRIDVAKREAARFIDKRINDAIGIVLFGNVALSRCPLTGDKNLLKSLIREIEIGVIDPQGTVVSQSLIAAANRLKQSKAKSKIIILLTDGEPSENDTDPQKAIDIAKQLGIRIYTIGIGDNQEVWVQHPLYGRVPLKTTLNKKLLTTIAQETGGRFFEAKNSRDMGQVYDTIDSLEKTKIETTNFSNYYDIFMPLVWFILALLLLEIILHSLIWFNL
jgi:Ca-activated chloride channel family protein